MRFDDRFLDELKSRIRLSDLVGRTVKLRRAGRELQGLSPFAKEKTPSFYVNDDKAFFHDFSSGKHGDAIDWLRETERLSFPEAVERLAAIAGMSLPARDPQAEAREQRRKGLAEWLELAAAWYEAQLRRPAGEAARAYLDGRGLPAAEWARFRIGYAPAGRTGLKDYLIAKGATVGELVDSGLAVEPEGGGAPYDRFRDRIMFPIADGRGRLVSFGGRAMDPGRSAKYLNGPETALFHKGAMVYGLAEARRLLHTDRAAGAIGLVVVEGYMDVIAGHRAGVPAVAPMGTALTEDQVRRLWALDPEPVLCFDGDNAGRKAARRAIERTLPLLGPGRSLRFVELAGGEDPDDVLRKHGPEALRRSLAAPRAMVEVLFAQLRDEAPHDTPERRAGLRARLLEAAGAIGERSVREAYREALLERYEALFPPRTWTRGRGADFSRVQPRGRPSAPIQRPTPPGPPSATARAAAATLAQDLPASVAAVAKAAIDNPGWLDDRLEALDTGGFGHPRLETLARALVRWRLEGIEDLRGRLAAAAPGGPPLLAAIDRSAERAGAPLDECAFGGLLEGLHRAAALDRELDRTKAAAAAGEAFDPVALTRAKGERDALRRALRA